MITRVGVSEFFTDVRRRPSSIVKAIAAGLFLLAAPALEAQQTGRITGRVTDAVSGVPLEGARILVQGSTLATGTNASGSFILNAVPAGTAEIRVIRLGYQAQRRTVAVPAGETATLDVAMPASAVQLEGVTVTVTGEQDKTRVGNAVATIQASEIVANGPIANMSDLMVAKAPGIQVLPGAITG